MPLSEKVKGKRRADDPEVTNIPTSAHQPRELSIRFTEGVLDLTLYVSEKDTVRDIKIKVRKAYSWKHNEPYLFYR